MYCRTCGKQVADGATICMNCGVPTGFKPLPTQTVSPDAKPKNPYAITGFVVALISMLFGIIAFGLVDTAADSLGTMLIWLAILGSVCGLVFSIIGLARKKHYLRGKGLALAGLIISAVFLVGIVLLIAFAFITLYGFLFFIVLLAGLGG